MRCSRWASGWGRRGAACWSPSWAWSCRCSVFLACCSVRYSRSRRGCFSMARADRRPAARMRSTRSARSPARWWRVSCCFPDSASRAVCNSPRRSRVLRESRACGCPARAVPLADGSSPRRWRYRPRASQRRSRLAGIRCSCRSAPTGRSMRATCSSRSGNRAASGIRHDRWPPRRRCCSTARA